MRKIKILELDQSVIKTVFTASTTGIWWKQISVVQPIRAASPIELIFNAEWDPVLLDDPVEIGSVYVNKQIFSKLESISDLYIQYPSFYFDFDTQILYLALDTYKNPIIGDVFKIGETIGFLSEAQLVGINGFNYPLNTRINGLSYEPRLGDISASESVDDQTYGLLIFNDLSADINNSDGKYDHIKTEITGNEARLLSADLADSPEEEIETGIPYKLAADSGDFRMIRRGIIEDVDYGNPTNPSINAIDPRSDWTQTINTAFMTKTEFSDLPEDYVDTRKQLAIGAISGISGIPLRNENVAAAFDYFITDTQYGGIQSISGVYFDGELGTGVISRFLTGSEYSINLNTGILTVNNVLKGAAWVDGVFTQMSETVDIILFLLDTFANFAYLDVNFNKLEIEEVRALGYLTHVFIDSAGMSLVEIIEKLVSDINIDFFQQESVLTMRPANVLRTVTEKIPPYQFIENPLPWSNDRTETIKTITVNYNKNYRTELLSTYYDNNKQDQALENDRKAIDMVFDVNLTNSAHVEEIYTQYYSRFVNISRTVTLARTIPFTADLTDFISFSVVRKTLTDDKIIFANAIYKIVNINRIDNTCEAIYFEDAVPEPAPTGFVKITPNGKIKKNTVV